MNNTGPTFGDAAWTLILPAYGIFAGAGDALRGTGSLLGGQPYRNAAAQQPDSSEPGSFAGFGGQIYAAGAGADKLASATLKFTGVAILAALVAGGVYLYAKAKS